MTDVRGCLPRAIFFDLDDTLIDDSADIDSGWTTACNEACNPSRGIDPQTLIKHIHEVRIWYWSEPARHKEGRQDLRRTSAWIVAQALSKLGCDDSDLAMRIGHRYRDLRDESIALFPDSIETLEKLRRLNVQLALLTNGSAMGQRAKIERFDLAQHFDCICVEGELGWGKPDERVYMHALKSLNVEPERVWMVGDNLEWDVAAPMRLGIAGVWFDRFKAGLPDGHSPSPSRVMRSLSELL
jgi:putative hydrolase of the HAD superfamily